MSDMAITINSDVVLTPPVHAATAMVLRDGAAGLEVLLMRRHGDSGVLGGVHVFPGGKLDAPDREVDPAALDQSPERCRQALNEPTIDAATATGLHVAALRETFEECGLLLGVAAVAGQLRRTQEHLRAGSGFAAALQRERLPLAASCLVPWSRWITPRVPSLFRKTRFDSRFFVALAPAGQVPAHDDHEATEAVWLGPRAGLQQYWDGRIELAPPQIMSLSQLTRFARVADVLAVARSRLPALIEPEPFDLDGRRVICYPGDPAHSICEPAWPGPTRLTHSNQRFEPDGGLEALLGPAST